MRGRRLRRQLTRAAEPRSLVARAAWAAWVARVPCARLAALPSKRPAALTPPRDPASGPGLGPRATSQRVGAPLLALVLDDLRPVPAQGEAGAQAAEAAIFYLGCSRARGS